MGADEEPYLEEEREEVVEIHPPIPQFDEDDDRDVRWEHIDPEELIYPDAPAEPPAPIVNLMDLLDNGAHQNPELRQEALGLINQYLLLREQIRLNDDQLPLIIEHGRIVANPNFNIDEFRMGGDEDEN